MYTPDNVWKWEGDQGGKFGSLNQPTAGARFERDLPVGEHPLQLYSLGTPNGVKVTVLLEELLELGIDEAEYNAHLINIMEQDQFSSGFVKLNPNSKIPALYDKSTEVRVFESGSILLYLAEKHQKFLSKDLKKRTETMNWLFWQMGSAPYLGGGFGHFYAYAPEKIKYAIDRFSLETKRQLDVLDKHLQDYEYLAGDEYSIADMAVWPWYGALVEGRLYSAEEFLDVKSYENVVRWSALLKQRPAVKRGSVVNKTWGEEGQQLKERHSKNDFASLKL